MRSLADQTVDELGGRWSILVRQKQDHIRLDRMLDQLSTTSGDAQDELVNRICRLVFTHAFAEEAVLWPALRRLLPDGDGLTARVEREHQEITELVSSLEQSPGEPGRRRHDAAPTRRRLGAGTAYRPHAHPPDRVEAPAGPVALGDPVEHHRPAPRRVGPRRATSAAAGAAPLVSASNRVGAIARRIEQLPPLRRGERPETHVPAGGMP